jgi:hypothetical protein
MADLEIGDLVLSLPELGEAEAAELGRMVVEGLAERLGSDLEDRRLGVVNLRLKPSPLRGRALADHIADRVAEAIS